MEITLDKIYKQDDPYQAFLDSIKNKGTLRKYKNNLYRFLKSVPNPIYEKHLGRCPESDQIEVLARSFVDLAKGDPHLAQNIIATFIKEDKKKVEQKEISPNTFPTHIKPIRKLLDANSIPIHWKSLHILFPREQITQDRAYTREELQKMIEVATDITDKVIVTVFSSAGFRLEAWKYLTWRDIEFFRNKDGSFRGAAILIYRGDPESYWSFITPEACAFLEQYRELWKSQVGRYPKPDEPLLKTVKTPMVRRLNEFGIKKRIWRMANKIGLRPHLPAGKRRHEIQLAHGFRKYFNTMMRRAKVNPLDKEDMMGHSVGLEKHYERYQEEDFERFSEYQKAIPFLTISDEERLQLKAQQLADDNLELAKRNEELEKQREEIQLQKDEVVRTKQALDTLREEVNQLKNKK